MIYRGGQDIPRYVTGAIAAGLALYFIRHQGANWIVLAASSFLFLICISDTLFSKIPNLLNFTLLLFAFGYHTYQSGIAGLQSTFLGLLTGLILFLLPFLMGGMGAGDVKALAALGALLGPGAIFQVFLYTGLWGGLMGLLQYLFVPQLRQKAIQSLYLLKARVLPTQNRPGQAGYTLRFPYAAAIAFGYFAYLSWGGLLKFAKT